VSESTPFVQALGLHKTYAVHSGLGEKAKKIQAVDGVNFGIRRGEVFALVGESGSGKSTVGKLLLRLEEVSSGRVLIDGTDLISLGKNDLRAFRRRIQMIFQDPFSSLNPHMRVNEMLHEALTIHGLFQSGNQRNERIGELLQLVGLAPEFSSRYPHEFSGGQRQRISIARALAVEPEFIVADEAVSALDVSNQAQIINVLMDLKNDFGLTMLFISHNMAVVQNIADTVAVMYLGKLMEIAPAKDLFRSPKHPYTTALLSAIPVPEVARERKRIILQGDMPSPLDPPSGCVFRTRCSQASEHCAQVVPALTQTSPGRWVACHLHQTTLTESL
jgi:oligopeptide transport system ATP-binding protein